MFWSIKMSKEREKPKPIAATAADRGNCSMGALSMVRTSLYRKWSTVKIIQHGVHQVCSREKRENKKRKEITDKMTELVKRETCHGRCKKREWSRERESNKNIPKTSGETEGSLYTFVLPSEFSFSCFPFILLLFLIEELDVWSLTWNVSKDVGSQEGQ